MAIKLFNKTPIQIINVSIDNNLFTSKLLNHIEKVNINGKFKTKFYTEVNTNLKVGDKVYIANGNYDTNKLIEKNPLKFGANGYTILAIDNCSIVLDIDYTGLSVKKEESIDSFISIYVATNQEELDFYSYGSIIPSFSVTGGTGSINAFLDDNSRNLLYVSTLGLTFGGVAGTYSAGNGFYKYIAGDWVDKTSELISGSFSGFTGSNNRLYNLGDTFTYSTTTFDHNLPYEFKNSWIISSDYLDPYISKGNFRSGRFEIGRWTDGLFGSVDQKAEWSGIGSWRNGIIFNSIWSSGTFESKSDLKKDKIYYSVIENGIVKQNIDTNNYFGNGLNFAFNTTFLGGTIKNGNFSNCIFTDLSKTQSSIESTLYGITFTSSVNLEKGIYRDSIIENVVATNSSFYNSNIDSSDITNSKFYNCYIDQSNTNNVEWNSDGLKIIDHDVWEYMSYDVSGSFYTYRIYKFYISESDFYKLNSGDPFYLKDLLFSKVQKDSIFNIKNELFKNKYDGLSPFERPRKVYLSTKEMNSYKVNILNTRRSGRAQNIFSVNEKKYYSIDFLTNGVDHVYNDPYVSDYTTTNEYYIQSISKAKVLNSDFEGGIFNGNWKSGFSKNANFIRRQGTFLPLNVSLDGSYPEILNITTQVNYNNYFLVPKAGDWMYMDNTYSLDYGAGETYSLAGWYKVDRVSRVNPQFVFAIRLADELLNIPLHVSDRVDTEYYTTNDNLNIVYGYLNKVLFTGSNIYGGEFDSNYFSNTNFISKTAIKLKDQLSINSLKLGYQNFNYNNNTLLNFNGPYIHGSFFDGNVISLGTIDVSVLNKSTINGASLINTYFNDGVFNSGYFMDSNDSNDLNNINNIRMVKADIYNRWESGLFNGGEFYNSIWYTGTATGGKLYKSDIMAITGDTTLRNVTLGDKSIDTYDTLVFTKFDPFIDPQYYLEENYASYSVILEDSIIDNAFIGGGTFLTNNVFNDGVIYGIAFEPVLPSFTNLYRAPVWNSGTFNNGQFIGSSIWVDGTFNNGVFNSFGNFLYGSLPSSNKSGFSNDVENYTWRGGVFNGGIFGESDFKSPLFSLDIKASWYDGTFTGGKFKGRVWRDGLFIGGEFEGFTTHSAINEADLFMYDYQPGVSNSIYGVWLNGTVTESIKRVSTKNVSNDFEIERIQNLKRDPIKFKNMLWVDGTVNSSNAYFENSIWLSGDFKEGNFSNSNFNPYVRRWDFLNNTTSITYSYSFDLTDNCVWNGGVLNNSQFWISDWNSGTFKYGTMSGGRFNKGVSNYMNAVNVIWEDGRWRNGNWYGSEFIFSTPTTNLGMPSIQNSYAPYNFVNGNWGLTSGAIKDIMTHQAIRNEESSYHIWNVFNTGNSYHYINNTEKINSTYSNSIGKTVRGTYSVYGYTGDFNIFPPTGLTHSKTVDGGAVLSKIGNGVFRKGDFENGVWNNGIRTHEAFNSSEKIFMFDTILNAYRSGVNKWEAIIEGITFSGINVGDSVSLGNITLIDINGKRKQYKDKCIVLSSDGATTIGLEFNIKFPIRNIEKDSEFHKIYLTRNNWISGVFLNGIFDGVWLDGMVKGFPNTTLFTQSHWVSGNFEGGYFYATASQTVYTYSLLTMSTIEPATYSTSLIQNGYFDGLYSYDATNGDWKTWLDLNYDNDDYLKRNDYSNVLKIAGFKTTNDVLEMSFKDNYIKTQQYPSLSRDFIMSYGTKYSTYDTFIPASQSNIDYLGFDLTASGYYTSYKNISVFDFYPTSLTSSQVSVYEKTSFGVEVKLRVTPSNTTSLVYNLGHRSKENIDKFRYGMITYDLTTTYSNVRISGFGDTLDGYTLASNSLSIDTYTHFDFNGYDTQLISFTGIPGVLYLDNIQYTEVDKIPFNSQHKEILMNGIYTAVVSPYEASAPFIDYTNNEFSFAGNVKFNFDTIILPKAPIIDNTNNPADENNFKIEY